MKRLLTLYIAITTFMLVFIGQADDENRFKVNVHVTCTDENIKTFIESNIKRELRSLNDVDIVSEEKATYFLNIVALHHIFESTNRKTGELSITYCFYSRFPSVPDSYIKTEYKDDYDRIFKKGNSFNRPHFGVMIWDEKNLKNACEQIVAKYDQKDFEPIRKLVQDIRRERELEKK